MNSQKLENLLNLALDATQEEREKSSVLDTAYAEGEKRWEVIVKYNGDLSRLAGSPIQVENLIAGYAIVTLPQSLLRSFAELDEVEYIEMPKRLFFSIVQAKEASCIPPVTIREPYLSGEGVIVAVIDSGIDYTRMDFRNRDGSSRILYLWDQSLAADEAKRMTPPEGFLSGVEFTGEQINAALETEGGRVRESRKVPGCRQGRTKK